MGVKGHLRPVGVGFVTLRRFAVGNHGGYGFVTFRPSSCRPTPANRSSAAELPSEDRFTFAAASTQDRQWRTPAGVRLNFCVRRLRRTGAVCQWARHSIRSVQTAWDAVLPLLADEDGRLSCISSAAGAGLQQHKSMHTSPHTHTLHVAHSMSPWVVPSAKTSRAYMSHACLTRSFA